METDAAPSTEAAAAPSPSVGVDPRVSGSVLVTSNVAYAEVWSGGQSIATLPLQSPLHLMSGQEIEVRARNYRTETLRINFAPGEVMRVHVPLEVSTGIRLSNLVPGTSFRIDGGQELQARAVGILCPEGRHVIELRATGYQSREEVVFVSPEEIAVIDARLRLVESAVARRDSDASSNASQDVGSGARTSAWISGSLAVASGVTALALAIWGSSTASNYDLYCHPGQVPYYCAQYWRATQDDLDNKALLVNVFTGLAGVGAAVALVSFILIPSRDPRTSSVTSGLRFVMGPTNAGVRFTW